MYCIKEKKKNPTRCCYRISFKGSGWPILKTDFQCLPVFWWLFVCVSLRNASSLGLIISKAMTTAWVTHKTPVKRSQQCFSALACSYLTHIFRFHSWPSHSGRVCLPYLSAKAFKHDEKCYSFFSQSLFLTLAGEYAAQGHLPAHPGKTWTAGESEVPQRWYWRTSYVIMSGIKPVIEIHSKHLTSKRWTNDLRLWQIQTQTIHYNNHRLLFQGNRIKP